MTRMALFIVFTIAAVLGGCGGSSSGTGAPATALETSTPCIGCHGTALSPGTGLPVADEWKASPHNVPRDPDHARFAPGCKDCHKPKPGHPNSCNTCHNGPIVSADDDVVRNPDAAMVCDDCHAKRSDRIPLSFLHYTANSAGYVTASTTGKCRTCHNPHNVTLTRQHLDWANSGHGRTTASPWGGSDFKRRGTSNTAQENTTSSACVRCHTTTGYVRYVTSGFRNISAWGSSNDRTREVLFCSACHADTSGCSYGYVVRGVAPAKGFYNYSISRYKKLTSQVDSSLAVQYPDLGSSNICMPCHIDRYTTGRTLKAIDAYLKTLPAMTGNNYKNYTSFYRNFSPPGAHNLGAGAMLYRVYGYEFPGQNYANDTSDDPFHGFKHDQIGINNINGTGTRGPCATCHIGSGHHTFRPFSTSGASAAPLSTSTDPADIVSRRLRYYTYGHIDAVTNTVCQKCHNSDNPMTAARASSVRDGYTASLTALCAILVKQGFLNTTGAVQKNWRNRGVPSITITTHYINNVGAYFNYAMLTNERGGFAHNRIYAKRLIIDSIDWLNNGILDGDAEAAINSLSTIDADTKSAAITYLLGGPGGVRP